MNIKNLFIVFTALTFSGIQSYAQKQKDVDDSISLKIISPEDLTQTRNTTKGVDKLRSVYLTLWYDLNNITDGEWFYDEINVPKGEDPVTSYYSAIGGNGFYCGIQANSEKERRVIFSVWDDRNGNNDERKTSDTNRTTLLKAGEGVTYGRFGNEGSGEHTHWVYDWKSDSTYKFLVHCQPDKEKNSTIFTMFFWIGGKWKMMAKISRPHNSSYLKNVYSFLEDFSTTDDKHRRGAYYNNQWVRRANGEWVEVTKALFNTPFGDQHRQVKDYGCQLSPDHGYLMIAGGGYDGYFLADKTKITHAASNTIPVSALPE